MSWPATELQNQRAIWNLLATQDVNQDATQGVKTSGHGHQ
jgi:hypothetical protein